MQYDHRITGRVIRRLREERMLTQGSPLGAFGDCAQPPFGN